MQEFTLTLAGTAIGVTCLHESTRQYCVKYVTEDAPEVLVSVGQEDIDAERARSEEGSWSDAYLETLALYRKIAEALVPRGILLFHGSAIAVDGEAYLFTALSGTGKSTHTRLWRKLLPEATMVNDDKPLLRLAPDGRVYVCGTPWAGKHKLETNVQVPLKAIALLERGAENCISPVTVKDAFPQLYLQSYRSEDPAVLAETLPLLDTIAHRVDLWRLSCNMESEAARVAYDAMKKGINQ